LEDPGYRAVWVHMVYRNIHTNIRNSDGAWRIIFWTARSAGAIREVLLFAVRQKANFPLYYSWFTISATTGAKKLLWGEGGATVGVAVASGVGVGTLPHSVGG
jgi:hypothetical protein